MLQGRQQDLTIELSLHWWRQYRVSSHRVKFLIKVRNDGFSNFKLNRALHGPSLQHPSHDHELEVSSCANLPESHRTC